jgi:hypothetical protein
MSEFITKRATNAFLTINSIQQDPSWEAELITNSLILMEWKSSLLCSWEPASGTYPEPAEFNPHLHALFL